MRTLPQGTIVSRPRGRIMRLWLCLVWYQWRVLWSLWRSAWVGAGPGGVARIPGKKLTKKERNRARKAYEKLTKTNTPPP